LVENLNLIEDLGSDTQLEWPWIQLRTSYFDHECHI
jgi:hypothetical protein